MPPAPGPLRQSLHNHTKTYSDGTSSPREIVAAAKGITLVGITDHCWTNKLRDGKMLTYDSIPDYARHVRRLSGNGAKVVAGVEIDTSGYGRGLWWIAKDNSAIAALNELDYLLLEHVADRLLAKEISVLTLDTFLAHLQKLRDAGLEVPVGLAHNNLPFNFRTKKEMKPLAKAGVFVELCSNGYAKTRIPPFYTGSKYAGYIHAFADAGGRISIGSDAHDSEHVREIGSAVAFVKRHGLKGAMVGF